MFSGASVQHNTEAEFLLIPVNTVTGETIGSASSGKSFIRLWFQQWREP
ncbi:MAG: hypothetical protein P8H62_02710 [Henriciella sp.]|nr:hypothetical protein [Henriciella sp.]